MKIGLTGMANAGKTVIFNALTGQNAEVTPYPNPAGEPNLAVVEVPDERIDRLSQMYNPKKTIYATVEIADYAGLLDTSSSGSGIAPAQLAQVKTNDALMLVARNFTDDMLGEADPVADVKNLVSELVITDLVVAENRLERIELSYKRGQKTPVLVFEEKTLRRVVECLEQEKPLRELDLTAEEIKALRGFQFLTLKPFAIILNSADDNFGQNQSLIDQLTSLGPVLEFAGQFEMDLAAMEPDEAQEFMEDMGIKASARDRLINFAYQLLGYISFFTVGSDEVRAWTINKGDTALDAAGTIHSDLARGFIRAECFSTAALFEHGSEKVLREKGLFRLEGKTYLVADGDILSIRFSV